MVRLSVDDLLALAQREVERSGLSIAEIAAAVCVKRPALYEALRGHHARRSYLLRILAALGKTVRQVEVVTATGERETWWEAPAKIAKAR